MHLTTRRLFQLCFGLLVTSVPAFCTCSFVTPEPSTFWVIFGAAGAMLLARRMRSKK
jgi:hypothetical protein